MGVIIYRITKKRIKQWHYYFLKRLHVYGQQTTHQIYFKILNNIFFVIYRLFNKDNIQLFIHLTFEYFPVSLDRALFLKKINKVYKRPHPFSTLNLYLSHCNINPSTKLLNLIYTYNVWTNTLKGKVKK